MSTRTLISHIGINGSRIIYAFMQTNYWQTCYNNLDKRTDINRPFVDASKLYVIYSLYTFSAIGVILNLAAWRYRHLTKWIFYLELLMLVV